MTTAVGYDLVVEIGEESYELTRTGDGVGYAFRMNDETRRRLADAVRSVVPNPRAVERFEIEPGYVRLRVDTAPGGDVTVGDYHSALRHLEAEYNHRHASAHGHDELTLGGRYVATYQPEETVGAEAYIDRHTGDDRAPDSDGPILEETRDPDRQMAGRRLSYRVVVLLDPVMYDPTEHSYPFEWDGPAVEKFAQLVEDRPRWPSTTRRVAVYPEHVVVDVDYGNLRTTPSGIGDVVRGALASYNSGSRGVHPDLGGQGKQVLMPQLELRETVHVEGRAPPDGEGADAWIEAAGVADVDGDPYTPVLNEDDDSGDEVGAWSKLNPFGD
jgi:hypothetical protein